MKDRIVPLITAAQAFPEMEARAVATRGRIWLSFRVFDAATKLQTDAAIDAAGGDDWAALIAARARDGVDVRIQVADFDPIAAPKLHGAAWASLRRLAEAASHDEAPPRFEAMASLHPARFGPLVAWAFAPIARREIRSIRDEFGATAHEKLPGFERAASRLAPRIHPASHHQKIAIFDDAAIVGGLDVDERRWDTPDHDRPSPETWRDVTLLVEGAPAAKVAETFTDLWNRSVDSEARFIEPLEASGGLRTPTRINSTKRLPEDVAFSIVRTRSEASNGLFSFGPKTVEKGILEEKLEAICRARDFLYIETQFLRSAKIADALVDAARRARDLELVIVLPFAPERFAFDGRRDRAMRHAEALQSSALERITRAFGDRCAALSPAKPQRADSEDGFTAYGAGIVYVHSKVLLADDDLAIIGSANLNDRSLSWDTEVAAVWRDCEGVRRLRERLAESWLGGGAVGDLARVATWRAAAEANAAKTPLERDGFLLPHDGRRAASIARRSWFLPDALF
ncbi:MAG: phospholipase D family protein [Pseudomonadota bacterium]